VTCDWIVNSTTMENREVAQSDGGGMAEAHGNRTHFPAKRLRDDDFEDRGGHQPASRFRDEPFTL
jgi:hypothetical protein